MRLLSTEAKRTSVASALGGAFVVAGVALVAMSGVAGATTTSPNGDIVACVQYADPDTITGDTTILKVGTNSGNDHTVSPHNDIIIVRVTQPGYTITSATETNDNGTSGQFTTESGVQPGQGVFYRTPNDARGTYIATAKVCATKPAMVTTTPPISTTTTTTKPPVTTTTTVPPTTTTATSTTTTRPSTTTTVPSTAPAVLGPVVSHNTFDSFGLTTAPTAKTLAGQTGTASEVGTGGLASTGVNAVPLVAGGLVLIGTGTAALVVSHRRRER